MTLEFWHPTHFVSKDSAPSPYVPSRDYPNNHPDTTPSRSDKPDPQALTIARGPRQRAYAVAALRGEAVVVMGSP
jgi:hypothetical protein